MALTIPAGINILAYAGTTALPLTGNNKPSWLTTTNVLYLAKQAPNRLGFVSFLAASPGFASFTTLDVVNPGEVLSGYILYAKVSFSVPDGVFVVLAAPTSGLTPLAAPVSVSATAATSSSITTYISAVSGAVGYQVYGSDTQTGTYSLLASTTSTTYLEAGLTASKQRWYKWKALGDGITTTDSVLSTAATATTLAATAPTPKNLLLAFGNSQTQGDVLNGDGSVNSGFSPGSKSWPAQLATILPTSWDVVNLGHNGNTFADLSARVNADVASRLNFTTYTRIVVTVQEFTNSFSISGDAQAVYNQCRDLIAQIKALNNRVEVVVLSPYYRSTNTYATFNTAVTAIADRMRQDYGSYLHANAMLDVQASQYMDTPSDADNPATLFDGTHGTADFNQVIAYGVRDAALSGTGVIPANHIVAVTGPTYGGTPHGIQQALAYSDGVVNFLGASDGGSFKYRLGNDNGGHSEYSFPYTQGAEIRWSNSNADWFDARIDFYKDGSADPVVTSISADGKLMFADYPTDGLTHTVRAVWRDSVSTSGLGAYLIFFGATRYV